MQLRLIRSITSVAVFCVSSIVLVGCGGDDGSYQGATGTVSGVVKLDGKPLTETATVTFLSKEGFAASGQTDSSGNFTLKYKQNSNIPVGKYAVSVIPAAGTGTGKAEDFMDEETGESKTPEVKSAIPSKVQSPGGSGISKEVKEGEQTIDIEI